MTWFTWRQFRTSASVAAAGLVVASIALLITGHSLAGQWRDSGVGACHGDCDSAISSFLTAVYASANGLIYQAAIAVMYAVPALIGVFWGAPLIARELETGTYRLAWNQSITRTRWLATKIAMVGGAAAVTAGLLSWAVTAWSHHLDHVEAYRIAPSIFGARGIVPIGYALFAFALGVTMGMLIRRAVPAMAVTAAVYVAAVVAMPLGIRAHLMPARDVTSPLVPDQIHGLQLAPSGVMHVISDATMPGGAWVLSNTTITSTGRVFTGPVNAQYCGPDHGPQSCMDWLGSLGLRQHIIYQPGSHFWPLQWIETGIFVAVAALLVGFCFWWTRRRLT